MLIKDNVVEELILDINGGTKVPDSYGVQTVNNFKVDFKGCPTVMLAQWILRNWWIDAQKVIRKMTLEDVHALNGTTVSYTFAKTKFSSISPEQAKSITIRTYKGLIAEGKFAEAEDMLFEITGEHSQAWKDAHPDEDDDE